MSTQNGHLVATVSVARGVKLGDALLLARILGVSLPEASKALMDALRGGELQLTPERDLVFVEQLLPHVNP